MSKIEINNLFKFDLDQYTLSTENEQGTGLGLIIFEEFVYKNERKISVDSEAGKGSIFKLEIPA